MVAAFPTGLQVFPREFVEKSWNENKKKEWWGRGRGKKETLARKLLACEQQTYIRSSLLSLRKREEETRRPEVRLLFAGKQTPRFWKTAFAHKRSFWLVRCWYCWLLSTRNINQTRYALFTCATDLASSDLWSQITGVEKGRPPSKSFIISRNGYLDLRCVRNDNIFNYTKFRPRSSFST